MLCLRISGVARQLAGPGVARLVVGGGTLGHGEHAERRGDHEGDQERADEHAPAAALRRHVAVRLRPAGREEPPLVVADVHIGVRRPRLGQVEAASARVAGGLLDLLPVRI